MLKLANEIILSEKGTLSELANEKKLFIEELQQNRSEMIAMGNRITI